MFNENLKTIRKAKGYTQEELAIKIHVVRQTISKWEKGLSVPDADVLSKLADVLEINVSELLGSEIKEETNKNEVSEQLAKISEQLALKNRRRKRIWKVIGFILLAVIVINMLLVVLGILAFLVFLANEILHFYCAMACSQLPILSKNRIVGSFIAYFVLNIPLTILMAAIMGGLTCAANLSPWLEQLDVFPLGLLMLTTFLLVGLLLDLLLYLPTRYILKNKLNLE